LRKRARAKYRDAEQQARGHSPKKDHPHRRN
jgi:hypothetical protein